MTSRAALLIVGSVALATTSVFAARWDPPFVDEPRGPGEITLPPDLQLPMVDWTVRDQQDWLADCHVLTLDSHALTIDGRVIPRPPDPNAPFLLPGDVLVPQREKRPWGPETALLFFDARTPFSVVRGVVRGLLNPPRPLLLVVERTKGSRTTLDLHPTRHHELHRGPVVNIRRSSTVVGGTEIPRLAAGTVDVPALHRTLDPHPTRPITSVLVVPDDDAPLGDVASVLAGVAPGYPVVEVWPGKTVLGPPITVTDLTADARAMEKQLIEAGRF